MEGDKPGCSGSGTGNADCKDNAERDVEEDNSGTSGDGDCEDCAEERGEEEKRWENSSHSASMLLSSRLAKSTVVMPSQMAH